MPEFLNIIKNDESWSKCKHTKEPVRHYIALHKSVIDTDGEAFPEESSNQYMWRGIGDKELQYILKTGLIKSKGKGNDAEQDNETFFSDTARIAEGYARGGYDLYGAKRGYVLQILRPGYEVETETGELMTKQGVPVGYIVGITPVEQEVPLQKSIWREDLHPRDKDGKFTRIGKGSTIKTKQGHEGKVTKATATHYHFTDAEGKARRVQKANAVHKKDYDAIMAAPPVTKAKSKKISQPKITVKAAQKTKNANFSFDWQPDVLQRVVANRIGSYTVHGTKIHNYKDLVKMFADLADDDREKVYVVATKGSDVLGTQCVHIGAINQSVVHPKDVLKLPVLSKADGFYVLHNHPSGDSTPSTQDLQVTDRLSKAAQIAGLEFKGHGVIGDNYSFIDSGGHVSNLEQVERVTSKSTSEVPLYETKQEKRDLDVFSSKISSPKDLWTHAVNNIGMKQGGSTIHVIGVDTKNRTVSAMPLDLSKSDGDIQKDIIQNLVASNAASFFVATGANASSERLNNIGIRNSADVMGIKLLDVVRSTNTDEGIFSPHTFRSYRQDGILDVTIKSLSLYIDLEKAITRAQAKGVHKDLPEGGVWRTVNGHHIYIKDNKILAGAFAGKTKPRKSTKAHIAELQGHVDKKNSKQPVKANKTNSLSKLSNEELYNKRNKAELEHSDAYHKKSRIFDSNIDSLYSQRGEVSKWRKSKKKAAELGRLDDLINESIKEKQEHFEKYVEEQQDFRKNHPLSKEIKHREDTAANERYHDAAMRQGGYKQALDLVHNNLIDVHKKLQRANISRDAADSLKYDKVTYENHIAGLRKAAEAHGVKGLPEDPDFEKVAADQRAKNAKSTTTQYHIHSNYGHIPVEGKKINIVPGIHTFVHKTDGGYAISEARSGARLAYGKTKVEATKNAKDIAAKHSAGKIQQVIDNFIASYGVAPDPIRKKVGD